MTKLKGVISPMITPLDSKMNIDEGAVRRLIDRLIKKGLNGLFLLGTQGEFPMIVNKEKRRLIKITVDEAKGRIPILANISDLGERKTEEVYNAISDLGVDAYILTPPGYYNVRDDGELINYYKHFSSITNRPVFIYDSSYTNSTIPTSVLLELSKEENIIGYKAFINYSLIRECYNREDFFIFAGDEKNMDMALKLGVDGVIPGISSLAVDKCIELYKYACNNQYEEAAKVQKELHEIQTVVFGERGQHWGNGHKFALSLLGICDDYVSTTLLPLTEQDKENIKAVVRKYNIS